MMEKESAVAAPRSMGPASGEELDGNASTLRTAETFLRLVPIGLCVSALVLMLKNSQENEYGSIAYTDLGAFRYLVHANGICAGYSLLSAAIVAMPRPSTTPRAWTLFLLDQMLENRWCKMLQLARLGAHYNAARNYEHLTIGTRKQTTLEPTLENRCCKKWQQDCYVSDHFPTIIVEHLSKEEIKSQSAKASA